MKECIMTEFSRRGPLAAVAVLATGKSNETLGG
jgi:hypothetical protein